MPNLNHERSVNTARLPETMKSSEQELAKYSKSSSNRQLEIEHTSSRLARRLQRTLCIETQIELFCEEITELLHCDSVSFQNPQQQLSYTFGHKGSSVCKYTLKGEEQYLGDLIATRNKPFTEQELQTTEELISTLVYPLKNALMYQRAVDLSLKDPLTGFGNRNALEKTIEHERQMIERYETPFSILMVGLDLFKQISNLYGKNVADNTIQCFSQTISEVIRETDQLFHYEGENFVVLLNNTDINKASFLAERLVNTIEQVEMLSDAEKFKVTISIGIADFEKDGNIEQLFECAEQGLHTASENGCNQVSYCLNLNKLPISIT
jgi:diguanylate cyclase (GGDEF)-like protein